MSYNKYGNSKDESKDIVEKIINEIKKESPDWKALLKENGYVDKLTCERSMRNLNPTQLRKFFEEIKNIKYRLEETHENWKHLEADMWKIIPTLKYASAKGNVPSILVDFVENIVLIISEEPHEKRRIVLFDNFERVFEAIVAYHKYHKEVRRC